MSVINGIDNKSKLTEVVHVGQEAVALLNSRVRDMNVSDACLRTGLDLSAMRVIQHKSNG